MVAYAAAQDEHYHDGWGHIHDHDTGHPDKETTDHEHEHVHPHHHDSCPIADDYVVYPFGDLENGPEAGDDSCEEPYWPREDFEGYVAGKYRDDWPACYFQCDDLAMYSLDHRKEHIEEFTCD